MASVTAVLPSANSQSAALVAGIDTHKHTHYVAILDSIGRRVADREFPTTSHGYRQLVEFLQVSGPVERVGVEGTGSYGALHF